MPQLHFFDNGYQAYEKRTNPVNMSIAPGDIMRLTQEGRSVSLHQLDGSLFYPNIGEGVMPMEFIRGIDENDCWEASQDASDKVKEYLKQKKSASSMVEEHT